MKLIAYDQSYESKLLNLWNTSLYVDQVGESVFRKQVLFDENFDPELCLLAVEDDDLLGFALGIMRRIPYLDRGLEPHRAWISVMAVDAARRKEHVGSALVTELEERFAAKGAHEVTIAAYSPNYFFPGIDQAHYPEAIDFFCTLGYVMDGEAVSMCRELYTYHMSEDMLERKRIAEAKGFRFEKFTYPYSQKLLKFLGDEFGGGWKCNALMVMQKQEAEQLIWIVIDQNNEVVGFCMRKMDGCDHRFGPFGVSESLRSHGLGSILFELMMEDMKKEKVFSLYFLWTHGAGQRFYERHGVHAYRQFTLGKKRIGEGQ